MIKVGVASKTITPEFPDKVFLGGYAARNHTATGVHDDLFAKALCLKDESQTIIWVTMDVVGLVEDLYDRIRKGIEEACGTYRIILSATHDHSAPDTRLRMRHINESWCERMVVLAVDAAVEATENCSPVNIYFGTVPVPSVARNRRGGTVVDDQLSACFFVDEHEDIKGILVNYACHCTVLDSSNYLISSDYAGYLRSQLEKEYNSSFVMFVNGACGNINIGYSADASALGVDMGDVRSYSNAKKKANELAAGVNAIYQKKAKMNDRLVFVPFKYQMPFKTSLPKSTDVKKEIETIEQCLSHCQGSERERLAVKKVYLDCIYDNLAEYHVEQRECILADGAVLRIGEAVFLTVPVELFCELGLEMKKRLGDKCKLVICGYSNGYYGYLPTKEAFARGGYECDTSIHNEDGGEILMQTALHEISNLLALD